MGLERNERKKVKYRSNRVKNRRKLFLPREADGANGLRLDVINPVPRVPVDAAALWVRLVQRVRLLRQYMHNTEIAVTMRLSTILKTIKQPL